MSGEKTRSNTYTEEEKRERTYKNKLARAQRSANKLNTTIRIKHGNEWVDVKPKK